MIKQITYIRKPLNGSHEHITHCGNSSSVWELSITEMIRRIESNLEAYYVQDPKSGQVAYVGVVRSNYHPSYLRTYANGNWNDNLLSLPNRSATADRVY